MEQTPQNLVSELAFEDEGSLFFECEGSDMLPPFEEDIALEEIQSFDALRDACGRPGYKIISSRMEMHLFRMPCYRCSQPFMAWALYAPDGCRTGISWDAGRGRFVGAAQTHPDVQDIPGYTMYVRALPPRVLEFLRHELGAYPWKKMQPSPGHPSYYANRCGRCGAIHGDHYLHLEGGDHQFWPARAHGVRKLEFEPSYLFMYFGLYRPLRPSAESVSNVLHSTCVPDEGMLMMGCAYCDWAAVFDADQQVRPLAARCSACLAQPPFLTAACSVVRLETESEDDTLFSEVTPHAQ